MKKRITSLVLVLVMLLTAIPFSAFTVSAATDYTEPTFVVQSVYAEVGSIVDVKVDVKNNPGIAGATLNIDYDSNLTLIGATNGDAFSDLTLTLPGSFTNPSKFLWDSLSGEVSADDTILILKFRVSEDALENSNLNVNVSYQQGDIYNEDMEEVSFQTVNGCITVINYIPGDVNDDGIINGKDVTFVRRHIVGGYEQTMTEEAADVNADGRINGMDVTLIRRHIVDGTELKPAPVKCNHNMTFTEYKAATCETDGNIAYWYCSVCDRYFSDKDGTTEITLENTVISSTGHTVVVDEAVAPTHISTGLTEGSHCSVCEKVIVEQQVVPKLEKNEYSISYHISDNDTYLQSIVIDNPNSNVYSSEDGLKLKNLTIEGYEFLGWYDLPSGDAAVNIKEIEKGTKGTIELYARLKPIEYKVQYKSDIFVDKAEDTYKVNEGLALSTPRLSNYIFTGWTDEDGVLYKDGKIPVGTTGALTLTANWTSERNKTFTKPKLDAPIIVEDESNNTIFFTYEIGEIQNVPIYTIYDFGYIAGDGITQTRTETYSTKYDDTMMQSVARSVSNATTKSSDWTLSKDWNECTSLEEQSYTEKGLTEEEALTFAKSSTDTWNVSSGTSGSSSTTSMSTNQSGWENQAKINLTASSTDTDSTTNREYTDNNFHINGNIGYKPPEITGGVEGGVDLGYERGWGSDKTTGNESSDTLTGGFEAVGNQYSSSSSSSTSENSSSWNSSSSKGGSKTNSSSETTSKIISEKIANTYGYGKTYTQGGGSSESQGLQFTQSENDEYGSSVTYSKETEESITSTWTTQSTKAGYHRWIMVGKAHVFAVVGYDMSTKSYFTYTYSVMDDIDPLKPFEDYSYTTGSYNDAENGVIPFEIPFEVAEYVAEKTCYSAGLKVNQTTGVITGYNGTDDYVVIPEYMNVGDGDVVKITGISTSAFKGNIYIKEVRLSDFITEIPDNAFEGCSSLYGVTGGSVTSIGASAFKDCTSMENVIIDNYVKSIGLNAFVGCERILVNAANIKVAEATVGSGAKNIQLYVNAKVIENGENAFMGKTLVIPEGTELFAFCGYGYEYPGLAIVSSANQTVVNKTSFENYDSIPIKSSSSEITLNQVTIRSTDFGIVATNDNVNLLMQADINVTSKSDKSVLCKNVLFGESNENVEGKLIVSGKIYMNGSADGVSHLAKDGDEIVYIDNEKYNNLLNPYILLFNANGGTVNESRRVVYKGENYSAFPTPEREHYSFDGWYTSADGGTRVLDSAVCNITKDTTLYAHWTLSEFNVTFDANGGQVATQEKTVIYGSAYGELPVPSRNDCTFLGWFTEDGIQVTAETIFTGLEDCTVKAYWESSWVKASEIPTDAKIVDTKWKYNLTSYTTSSSKTMSGWTLYDTTSKWGSYGSWSSWQDSKVTASDSRQVETRQAVASTNYKTVYHYYRYANANGSSGNHTKTSECYNYEEYALDSQLTKTSWGGGYQYWYNGSNYHTVWKCSTFTTQEVVSYNYKTQYRYRDRSLVYTYYFKKTDAKESTSDPTGQENVSNVVKYVKYTVK